MQTSQYLAFVLLSLAGLWFAAPAAAQVPADERAAVESAAQLAEGETAAAVDEYDPSLFPQLNYYEAPALFLCPVHLPTDYEPERSYPLVIGLHGFASSPERYHTLFYAFDDPQFIYAAPQGPYPLPMGNSLGYNWFLSDQDDQLLEESKRLSEQYVMDMIQHLSADYNVKEIYLLGFSQGGALAYITGINRPDIIRGIICFDSPFDLDWFDRPAASKAATDLRVFVAHATDDHAVEYQKGVDAAEQLRQLGFQVRFLPFEGGHTLTADALKVVETWIEQPSDAE